MTENHEISLSRQSIINGLEKVGDKRPYKILTYSNKEGGIILPPPQDGKLRTKLNSNLNSVRKAWNLDPKLSHSDLGCTFPRTCRDKMRESLSARLPHEDNEMKQHCKNVLSSTGCRNRGTETTRKQGGKPYAKNLPIPCSIQPMVVHRIETNDMHPIWIERKIGHHHMYRKKGGLIQWSCSRRQALCEKPPGGSAACKHKKTTEYVK